MRIEQREGGLSIDGGAVTFRVSSLSGLVRVLGYTTLEAIGSGSYRGVLRGRLADLEYRVEDRWSTSSHGLRLTRELEVGATGATGGGLAVELSIALPPGQYRFFIPAACYDSTPIEGPAGEALICEERMSAPLVMAYDESRGGATVLLREAPEGSALSGGAGMAGGARGPGGWSGSGGVRGPARWSRPADRNPGQTRFLQQTEIGALGFRRATGERPASLVAALPRCEMPASRMLDRDLSPFAAYLPPGRSVHVSAYRVSRLGAGGADGSGASRGGALDVGGLFGPTASSRFTGFDEACFAAYSLAASGADLDPLEPPGGLRGCLHARLERMGELVVERRSGPHADGAASRPDRGRGGGGSGSVRTGFTGLALTFDPRVGTASSPSGYGTSFTALAGEIYPNLLEYGFTGRQLNNAYLLARAGERWQREDWMALSLKVVSSYLRTCVAKSGFLYTLYDSRAGRPLNPLGDPVGSRLLYGVKEADNGNYLRAMVDAASDLCLFSSVALRARCLGAARAFGDFLLRVQNRDGSWYRAYRPDGRAIMKPEEWFGGTERANRSSTATCIPLLVELARRTGEVAYRKAAVRAGEWLLAEVVERIDYRGGTLDNPNVVDREAMASAMRALLRLHDATGAREFLDGARLAGGLALTWTWLWDLPFEEGTRLAEQEFRTRGWSGINILWGAGVVDSSALWFHEDWRRLAELTHARLLGEVAQLILFATQQMLSLPGRSVDLVASGLQEEGFACSDQGADDGMITKGSTWGSLGWVIGAGTYPVWRALEGTDEPR